MLYVVKALLDGACNAIDDFASQSKLFIKGELGAIIKKDAVYTCCYFISSDDMISSEELSFLSDITGETVRPEEVSAMIASKEKLTFMISQTYNKLKMLDIEMGTYNLRSSAAYQYIAFLKSFSIFITGVDGVKKHELYEIKEFFEPFDSRISEIPKQ